MLSCLLYYRLIWRMTTVNIPSYADHTCGLIPTNRGNTGAGRIWAASGRLLVLLRTKGTSASKQSLTWPVPCGGQQRKGRKDNSISLCSCQGPCDHRLPTRWAKQTLAGTHQLPASPSTTACLYLPAHTSTRYLPTPCPAYNTCLLPL